LACTPVAFCGVWAIDVKEAKSTAETEQKLNTLSD
jgi:hypothetical protein